MKISIINKSKMVSRGHSALTKIKSNQTKAMDNITLCLAIIIGAGLENGYRIELPYSEFAAFIGIIVKTVKDDDCLAVVSMPPDSPLGVCTGVRNISGNSIHTITNIDKELFNEVEIMITKVKPDTRPQYAVDFATKLL